MYAVDFYPLENGQLIAMHRSTIDRPTFGDYRSVLLNIQSSVSIVAGQLPATQPIINLTTLPYSQQIS